MIMELPSSHSWIHLVESSNTEVSGAFEVPKSLENCFFGSPAAVFLVEN